MNDDVQVRFLYTGRVPVLPFVWRFEGWDERTNRFYITDSRGEYLFARVDFSKHVPSAARERVLDHIVVLLEARYSIPET